MAERRRGFGHIRKLPSGRYQASYIGPDQRRHNAPLTFAAKVDCEGWLSSERRLIERDEWESPLVRAEREALQQRAATDTLRAYADAWLADGTTAGRLRPLTVLDYRRSLDLHILPSLGDLQLADIVRGTVGGFNRSSQHPPDFGGVQRWRRQTGAGRPARPLRIFVGSGVLTARCDRRCVRRDGRTRPGWCSGCSGG